MYITSADLLPNNRYMPNVEASPDKPLCPHIIWVLWYVNPETKVWRRLGALNSPNFGFEPQEWLEGAQQLIEDPRAYTVLPEGAIPPREPQPFAPGYDAATHKAV